MVTVQGVSWIRGGLAERPSPARTRRMTPWYAPLCGAVGLILVLIGAYIPVRAHAQRTRDATRIVIASLALITAGTGSICFALDLFTDTYLAGFAVVGGIGALLYLKYDYPDDSANYHYR